jgi:UDP-N-acetyl-D-mannosaminuronic acid dehydrogenase
MDAAVITNDHAEFRKIKWGSVLKEMRTKVLVDAKQTIRPDKAKALGFTYRGIGFA